MKKSIDHPSRAQLCFAIAGETKLVADKKYLFSHEQKIPFVQKLLEISAASRFESVIMMHCFFSFRPILY